jgi:ferredoxin
MNHPCKKLGAQPVASTQKNEIASQKRLAMTLVSIKESTMIFETLFKQTIEKQKNLAHGQVVPDAWRCVQCGICSYNCPAGIDIRRHALVGKPVNDRHCLTCGECILRCPRGVLHFEQVLGIGNAEGAGL